MVLSFDVAVAGISWRSVDFVTFPGKTPGNGMLASAAADNKNSH